ncbi:thiamine pyrophosphate-binding protein [Pseudoalteromonas sp. SR41-1]|uniref:thiamine pyrophosphate-binding protein n=1 Tax=Pseudoalteromonas sp. SR41-1 TaxID=2760952 RepID=UPI0015FF73A3|nr:thiamine pyrophosphate-binding protein [Pseudoalteromonas sp. SR41-1]MBB1279846.1 2-succinyl-5-enolpyruvyl-6-hydroxy-3-cyclohexene-1-carboxylate synthase [Pseudoalteromonas sp. SR41-1]
MSQQYTKEINAQIVISLLKAHGVKKVITSPGATNVALVGSIQNDPFFTVYSSVDERSAAYMACGLAEESGEPVAISCTGATASRNYIPGLTEAYYRKLPVLAITSTQATARIGHHIAQVIDRSSIQNDIVNLSVDLPIVKDDEDKWECEIKVNKAMLELTRFGGGPVHINLPTTYKLPFESKALPAYRVIKRFTMGDELPVLKGKVAVFVGSHKKWTEAETLAVDNFCAINNAVVFCDHTSNYKGKYRVLLALLATQESINKTNYIPDTLIHIGEVSGDYFTLSVAGREVWRVSEDGELRDTFRKLTNVFQMKESCFFRAYSNGDLGNDSYYLMCRDGLDEIRSKIPELPFSNIWVASQLAQRLPENSIIHLGILNSLRSWNFYEIPKTVTSASNVGGFGIDGSLSSILGASLSEPEKPYFCVLGDLAFFYDMNAIGNRHVGNNLRIMLINNGKGTEFRQYNSGAAYFGEKADDFIAAAEHYGNKSPTLVKQYVENLGFEYMTASTKTSFSSMSEKFLTSETTKRPLVFEVFTDSDLESKALEIIRNITDDKTQTIKSTAKKMLGTKGIGALKKVLKK